MNPTEEQLKNRIQDSGQQPVPQIDTSRTAVTPSMIGTQPVTLAPTTITPVPDITKLMGSDTVTTPVTPDTTVKSPSLGDRLAGLFTSSKGKAQETQTAVDSATSQGNNDLNQVNTQIKLLQAKSIANQEAAMRSGETLGFASREQQNVARTDAIEALKLSAIAEGIRGNITLAETHAKNAVDAKYAEIDKQIEDMKTNIYNNYDSFSPAEKKKADNALLRIDANDAFVKSQKEEDKAIQSIAIKLAEFGVDTGTVQKVMNAGSVNDAIALAGSKMQDPKAKLELEKIKLDMALTKEDIKYKQKATSLLGEPSDAEKKATESAIKEAKGSIPVMQDKITAVDVLKTSAGLNSRVGTSFLSRAPQGILGTVTKGLVTGGLGLLGDAKAKVSGSGQDFAGGIHKLVGGLTLQSLIDAKSRGATFGALSEGELNILANSASALNDWEIKDSKGNGTGFWNIDEKSFKKELDNIKTLTQRALTLSQGQLLSPDEQSVLDSLYQPGALSPASYFSN